jgi:hypothetical protein
MMHPHGHFKNPCNLIIRIIRDSDILSESGFSELQDWQDTP